MGCSDIVITVFIIHTYMYQNEDYVFKQKKIHIKINFSKFIIKNFNN